MSWLDRKVDGPYDSVIERCAGIDIGKTFLVACIMVGAADAEPRTEQRTYGTTNSDLEKLRVWLIEEGCTHVAIESTGSCWKPIYNILEHSVSVILASENSPSHKHSL